MPEETGVWESEIDEIGQAEQVKDMIMSLRYPRKKDLGEALDLTPVQTTRLLDTIYTMELATEVEVSAAFAKTKKLRDAKAKAKDEPEGEWESTILR